MKNPVKFTQFRNKKPENFMHTKSRTQTEIGPKKPLPPAGPRKRNPKELEKMLDSGLQDSMAVSDPVSTVMPEVKEKSGNPPS